MADLRWGSSTHEGQVRDSNEDNLYADRALFVVADGMGGHLAGEVASEITVTTLQRQLDHDDTNTLDDLVAAIVEANESIFNDATSHPDHAGMGTTVTAIAVVDDPYDGESFGVANVGDSRIYLMRHDRLRQVTIDHSFVQELVAEGAITRDEARLHPRRNIVTRGLGIEPTVRVDSWTMAIVRGDRFVLCSDGLSDYVHDDDITAILRRHVDDPQAAADELVEAANEAGGADNITVVVVDVLDGADPPDPTQEFDIIPAWDDSESPTTGEIMIVADPLHDDETDTEASNGATSDHAEPTAGGGENTPDDESGDERPKKSTASKVVKFALTVGVIAVIVGAFTLLAAWARSGYFVAFNDEGVVYVYQGQPERVLWFEPTPEVAAAYTRSELDDQSIEAVEARPEFSSLDSATRWVKERLTPLDEPTGDDTPTED